ncbi:hypothetical protein ABZ876_31140 [Streptomyces sp. NPDC046931]|uniref:hypothetical protein n=1 Tax=Streptomyces sp. NPDC046931 TaxID=3154806 RepID=UPI0033D53C4C
MHVVKRQPTRCSLTAIAVLAGVLGMTALTGSAWYGEPHRQVVPVQSVGRAPGDFVWPSVSASGVLSASGQDV